MVKTTIHPVIVNPGPSLGTDGNATKQVHVKKSQIYIFTQVGGLNGKYEGAVTGDKSRGEPNFGGGGAGKILVEKACLQP